MLRLGLGVIRCSVADCVYAASVRVALSRSRRQRREGGVRLRGRMRLRAVVHVGAPGLAIAVGAYSFCFRTPSMSRDWVVALVLLYSGLVWR